MAESQAITGKISFTAFILNRVVKMMLLHVRSNIPTNHTWQTSPKRDAHLFLRFRILPGPIVSRHKLVVPCPEILPFLIQRFPIEARYRVDVLEKYTRSSGNLNCKLPFYVRDTLFSI